MFLVIQINFFATKVMLYVLLASKNFVDRTWKVIVRLITSHFEEQYKFFRRHFSLVGFNYCGGFFALITSLNNLMK